MKVGDKVYWIEQQRIGLGWAEAIFGPHSVAEVGERFLFVNVIQGSKRSPTSKLERKEIGEVFKNRKKLEKEIEKRKAERKAWEPKIGDLIVSRKSYGSDTSLGVVKRLTPRMVEVMTLAGDLKKFHKDKILIKQRASLK